jgi:nitrite reductase (NO-forming)
MNSLTRRSFLAYSSVGLVSTIVLAACGPSQGNLDPAVAYAVSHQPKPTGGSAATPIVAAPVALVAAAPTATAVPAPTMTMEGGHVMAPTTAAGQAHLALDPGLGAIIEGAVKKVSFEIMDKKVDIAPGITLNAWTFGGGIPGPVLHVRQGDPIDFTLVNKSAMPHSVDFHAARTAPNVNYKNVLPDQRFGFTWTAKDPGVFMYHCGTAPILMHLAEGMYGAVVVDPVDRPLPKVDREFVFVQSEFYLTASQDGVVNADFQKAKDGVPDYVVFNGYANQYSEHPIAVKVGEKIRVHLMNAGPNHFSAFHVVGTIFDHVWVDGNPENDLHGIQTWTVAPGEGSSFDFTLSDPGNYPMVSHSFADPTKGAVAVFKAEA